MSNIIQSIEHCRAFVRQYNLSKTAFAKKAGLAPNTLRSFWEGDWNPSADTLMKLEAVMQVDSGTPAVVSGALCGKKILLIIAGGIAAYKGLDLISRLQDEGACVTGVLTKGGAEFITALSVASLSGNQCYMDLFDLKEESEMGHIRLSRDNDLIVIAPATADLMAKMAQGMANDLASTLLLATDKPVMVVPAMNTQMWAHKATQRNIATLKSDGIHFVEPGAGMLACGEVGAGRLAEVMDIVCAVKDHFIISKPKQLSGKRVIITAGPTHEPIDPVRYIANRSSGKQGFAIARALVDAGADVTLVAGPVALETPKGLAKKGKRIDVESARQMNDAVMQALPADIAIFVAAVADWRTVGEPDQKMKKEKGGLPTLELAENPDILATVSQLKKGRPKLVIGFAAETEKVIEHATAKRKRKGCDWIIANDVSGGVMGGDSNTVHIITSDNVDTFAKAPKDQVAALIVERVIEG